MDTRQACFLFNQALKETNPVLLRQALETGLIDVDSPDNGKCAEDAIPFKGHTAGAIIAMLATLRDHGLRLTSETHLTAYPC